MVIQLAQVEPGKLYQLTGESLLTLIRTVANETAAAYKQGQGATEVKHKYSTEEAAEYLGVHKSSMSHFNVKYKMEYEKGRPNYYTIDELKRVEAERKVKPF